MFARCPRARTETETELKPISSKREGPGNHVETGPAQLPTCSNRSPWPGVVFASVFVSLPAQARFTRHVLTTFRSGWSDRNGL